MTLSNSSILRYIIQHEVQPGDRLPTINELSRELGVSVGKIREELEVVRALGLVQVKPRMGTQVQEFCFGPAATLSVLYAVALNRDYFHDFTQVRNSVELGFWHEAVPQLTADDIAALRALVASARAKLNQSPAVVPFDEHRDFHLTFFRPLDNPFVKGLLEAYWAAYKVFAISWYAELSYHRKVWDYHERMVNCVAAGDFAGGRLALEEHMALLRHPPEQVGAANGLHAGVGVHQFE